MDGDWLYRLNEYAKIIINETEVYYGCVIKVDSQLQVAKLRVVDWRDKDSKPLNFKEIDCPTPDFIVKYFGGE
jgi:hypothetical protein